MPTLTNTTFPIANTLITEFKFHLGKYWRETIDNKTIVIVRKEFEENRAAALINKVLLDQLIARASRLPYKQLSPRHATKIRRVIRGPDIQKLPLRDLLKSM
jgi:hypothetical protein